MGKQKSQFSESKNSQEMWFGKRDSWKEIYEKCAPGWLERPLLLRTNSSLPITAFAFFLNSATWRLMTWRRGRKGQRSRRHLRATLQSRECLFDSHFPFRGAKFNCLYRNVMWEMGNEKWALWILISYFPYLTSHFLHLTTQIFFQLSFNIMFPHDNFISSCFLC